MKRLVRFPNDPVPRAHSRSSSTALTTLISLKFTTQPPAKLCGRHAQGPRHGAGHGVAYIPIHGETIPVPLRSEKCPSLRVSRSLAATFPAGPRHALILLFDR